MPQRNTALVRASFSAMAASFDLLTIVGVAVAIETTYYSIFYGWSGLSATNLQMCLFAAASFVVANAMRNEYSFANYLQLRGHGWRSFSLWSLVCLCAIAVGFLTKATEETSRAAFVLVYAVGFFAIYAQRATLAHFVRSSAAAGGVSARRLFLVGFEKDVEAFTYRYKPWTCGMHVVAAVVLRETESTLDDDLALAAASARMLRPDDVFILAPWSRTDVIDACVTAFLRVPARIHLGPERVLDRFVDAHIDKVGAISSLSLSGHPLNLMEVAGKRIFDVAVSLLALILLSPLLLVCALLIKLDSPGPALFLQRRYGFNRETFRIVKFRTMTTMDDGRHIKQATANDSRVTRVGRFMRRYNIDELPQLFNVLRGDMSLVGPRPHALAHDQLFERRIALYARRHNVKPGITGWAQVNGLRGEIDSPEKIRMRIEHDLYYIDNWSLIFDVWIIFLTIFSRKAYRNAI
ncbi:undecaprenyl-phosphate glucose phosphotransferase [Methylocystis sp. ATCC 49242]|uniref:undecaprenyl-phosphate glucose phosphotransferase n=1 Tax=Methylocystis sp. ATCC 49242 TaxID=622637 RepID=UPI0006868A6D|nr:undecaprenyl-phosphate glucose phosphotransferase [Methylocystis sp. ATCC 49242]